MKIVVKNKEWHRVLFHISQSSGKISREYTHININFPKISTDDLDLILTLLEKETGHFFYVRLHFKFKLLILILIALCIIFSMLFFLVFTHKVPVIIFLCLIVALFLSYMITRHTFFRKYYKHSLRKVYTLLSEANKRLFSKESYYMMLDPDLNYVALYTVPNELRASIQLTNLIEENENENHIEKINNYLSPNTKKILDSKDMSTNKTTDILKAYLEIKQTPLGLL